MTEAPKLRSNVWSALDEARAVNMWKEGKTAREISVPLGRTRNSIIGKMHRLKLGRSDQAVKIEQVINGKGSSLHKKRAKVIKLGPVKRTFNPAFNGGKVSEPQPMALVEDKGITGFRLIDPQFNSKNCKWWVSGEGHEARFCCQPVWGKASYCEGHQYRSLHKNQPTPRKDADLFKYLIRRAG